MGVTYDDLLALMLVNAPDPHEELPLSNQPATIWGVILPFLIFMWVAVALRLWVRFRIMREPGWDDALILVASCLSSCATVMVLISVEHYALGHHFLYLRIDQMLGYVKMFYFENALYVTNTALIKISLLAQYLRIFKAGTMNRVCKSLIAIIGLWGAAYGFMAWFPCFPPQAFWDSLNYPDALCYGFGFVRPAEFIALFESHTALNMVFDFTVFLTPMVLFSKPNLRMKNLIAMSGIFILGGVVVFISVWRLYSIIDNRAATYPYLDFTWWTPISIILSVMELDLAIMCASMPIFWPVIENSFGAIFVTREVQVVEQRRYSFADRGLTYELEHGHEMRRQISIKSQSTSRESLVIMRADSGENIEDHYRDPYLMAQVDPFGETAKEVAVKTDVEAKGKDKWVL